MRYSAEKFIAKTNNSCNDFGMESKVQYYRVDRREIVFLKFVIEACEGIATLSTVNPELGLILLRIPPGCEDDVSVVMKALSREILMEPYKSSSAV